MNAYKAGQVVWLFEFLEIVKLGQYLQVLCVCRVLDAYFPLIVELEQYLQLCS